MGLEDAVKSIFIQCLNEPDILKEIKDKLNDTGNSCVYEGKYLKENDNLLNGELFEKLDKIILNQKMIKDLIKSEINIPEKSKKEIRQYKEKLEDYQKQNGILLAENNRLITENKNMEEKYRIDVSKYSVVDEIVEIWDCISALSSGNKEYIESLCGGFDLLAVLSLGRDDNKIEQLWSYLREKAIKDDAGKAEVLKLNRYFEFCLKVANSTKMENDKYVMFDIELESEFDTQTCIRTIDSKQIGTIRNIIVRGVKLGENIKYKSIVKVE